ncbi:MAG: recombination mediator RecR [Firmicutes bacterium]|nr:recombination mediator RecR [Bacillota bacterium]
MTEKIDKLTNKFRKLPGVGGKLAQKYALTVLNMSEADVEDFAAAMLDARKNTRFCTLCGSFAEDALCPICAVRDKSAICVVEEPRDVSAMERVRGYKGVYHVLGGTINPLRDKAPENLRLKELLARVAAGGVAEVIIATNPNVEGDATAMYTARILKPFGVKVTKIAQGLSIGSALEFADEVTLGKAFTNRTEL